MCEKSCGCKGQRSCLICEREDFGNSPQEYDEDKMLRYCSKCHKAFTLQSCTHPHVLDGHADDGLNFPGIQIIPDFITDTEELELCNAIDKIPWVDSQSGRRKQDFGPKINFKKKKINISSFTGFPSFSRRIVNKMLSVEALRDFIPVELCDLEYTPERGSAIVPHFDDTWLWGERLVTLNLLSPVFLTMTMAETEVLVHLPRRSLVVLMGPARYQWEHSIKRQHVISRRLAMTFRELSDEFSCGGQQEDVGKSLIDIAQNYV